MKKINETFRNGKKILYNRICVYFNGRTDARIFKGYNETTR